MEHPGPVERAQGHFRRADGAHLQQHRKPLHAQCCTAEQAPPSSGAGGQVTAGADFQQNGTECASKISGDYYFTPADSSVAAAYKEYEGKGAALVPWKTTVGQMKKNYWLWNKDTKNFQYYANSGKALTVAELDENAKAQNTYTGYFKINGEYYCLDENGTPRTGDVTLTVNGVSAQYYFEPAANDQEIPGKMFHDCWKMFKTSAGEQWRYYEPAVPKLVSFGSTELYRLV